MCLCVHACVLENVKCTSSNDFQPNAYLLKWRVSLRDANGAENKYWPASCQIEAVKGWNFSRKMLTAVKGPKWS